MINSNLISMLSAINERSAVVLNTIMTVTLETGEFDDMDSLETLYEADWIDGICGDDECRWIMTDKGRKLYGLLEDLIV